jgi:HSP20 family protein
VVQADLPGLDKDDLHVEVRDDVITIRGERRHEHKERREGCLHSEQSCGTFHRSIRLPEGVDAAKAEATFRNGVLEITMPAPKIEGAVDRFQPVDRPGAMSLPSLSRPTRSWSSRSYSELAALAR